MRNRRLLLVALAYAVFVHAMAIWAEGKMTSPLRPTWDAEALAEAPPLARFDAGWLRSVAKEGYFWDPETGVGNVMIFPLAPILWRVVGLAGIPLFWGGIFLAHLFFLCSVVLLHAHTVEAWVGEGSPRDAAVGLLAFPWTFFLLAPYSESLFLALALGAFAAARRGRWEIVGLLGLLAGLTRLTALALVPALLWIAWKGRDEDGRDPAAPHRSPLLRAAAALSPALGAGAFLAWLGARFDDPLVYLHVQQSGWGRASGLAGLGRSLALIAENVRERGLLHLGPAMDLLVLLFLLAAAAWCLRRRAVAEGLYVAAGAALVLLSGSLLSTGRYAIVLFPMLRPLLALRRRPVLWYGYLAAALALQTYLIVRFVNNLWVA